MAGERPAPRAAPRGRVLVVEDDPDIRELLRALLAEAGYDVASAADGPEGLRLAHLQPPDVVILDLMLPGATGWEIAARFRGPDGRPAPVIVATAAPLGLFQLPASVACMLPKPFDPDHLIGAVDALVGRARAAEPAQDGSAARNPGDSLAA
ncbi:MAG TPA: response regulator transcription factor [Chloroflexota bacterium]|nr:response regulator transcription factor [Chloroflexota bacterium]